MWIILTLTCAFLQALWMALSKRRLQTLPSLQFMLFLRFPIAILFLPIILWCEPPQVTPRFWVVSFLAAVLECARLVLFAMGTRRDYYATFSLMNMSPLFVLLLAPFVVGEALTVFVIAGALCAVAGGFIFYQSGRFQMAGLAAAICQGVLSTLCKLGLNLSSPAYFMIVLYGGSALMLLAGEGLHRGLGDTMRAYQQVAKKTLPISALNLASIITFMYGLNLAPVTHFSVLFRTNLIFGFVLSVLLLKEYKAWQWKLAGAAFIAVGSIFIVLNK